MRNLDTVLFALVYYIAIIAAFDGRHFVDDDDFCGYPRQLGRDVMYVGYGVLEASTGSGAAMAGRAMLAARRICLSCIFLLFAKGRVAEVR